MTIVLPKLIVIKDFLSLDLGRGRLYRGGRKWIREEGVCKFVAMTLPKLIVIEDFL